MDAEQQNEIISKAKVASKEKNWKELLEILSPFRNNTRKAPRDVYPLLIRAYGKQGNFQEGEKLVGSAPASVRRRQGFLKAAAELYYESEQRSKSLPFLEAIHRNFDGRVSIDASKMYTMVLKGLASSEVEKSKIRSIGKVSESAGNAYRALDAGGYDDAISCFSEAIFELHQDATIRANWIEAFRILCDFKSGDSSLIVEPDNSEIYSEPLKAFSVSGTGWSGSGAIFDYFSEFSTVRRISKEFPFIQSKTGISGLYNRRREVYWRDAVVDFFKFDIFGFCGTEALVKRISTRHAKSLVVGRQKSEYSALAHSLILNLVKGETKSAENFMTVLRQITDSYLRFRANVPNEQESTIPMFDNIIHAYNLDSLRFAGNMELFCSVRDPRSNYVANKRENRAFDSSVEDYVKSYRLNRERIVLKHEKFLTGKKGDASLYSQVHFVQFENFVMDRAYRQEIAKKVGLNLMHQDEHSRFKPWVSEKNVYLFEDYENQEEIRYIEKELAEYCIDLEAFQSMRTNR